MANAHEPPWQDMKEESADIIRTCQQVALANIPGIIELAVGGSERCPQRKGLAAIPLGVLHDHT